MLRCLIKFLSIIGIGFFALPSFALAGSLSISAPTKVFAGDEFRVSIFASDDAKIDTVRIRGSYSADLLEWRGVGVGALSNASPGNSVDSAKGAFSFGAFTLDGGVTKGTVAVIRFRAKKEGTASIVLANNSLILAAGENQLTSVGSAKVQIAAETAKPTEPTKPVFDIKLSSPTNPNEDKWLNTSEGSIAWQTINGDGRAAVFMDVSQDPQLNPTTPVAKSPADFTITGDDGVYYARVRSTSPEGRTLTKTYRLLIDRTPPSAFEPGLEIDPAQPAANWIIRYASIDSASGISKYEVFINDQKIAETAGTQSILSYDKSKLAGQVIRVIAYDAAGNSTEGKIQAPEDRLMQTIPSEAPAQVIVKTVIPVWMWILVGVLGVLVLVLLLKPKKMEKTKLVKKSVIKAK